MGDIKGNVMRQFKDAHYKDNHSVQLYPEDDARHMYVDEPSVLAAFVAFCSGPHSVTRHTTKTSGDHRVFLRGCTRDYSHSTPSLFRCGDDGEPCKDEERKRRWKAYQGFLDGLQPTLKGDRWCRAEIGAVLQHYGLKTPWLDVVQNFYTAIWFATHRFSDQGSCHVTILSEEDWGWISFYVRKHPKKSKYLRVTDLPGDHSSRHLRPHAQQGASLAKQNDAAAHCERDQDLNEYRIAQVRFPNSARWTLSGYTFSAEFLFPAAAQDNSLEQLRRPQVQRRWRPASTEKCRCRRASLGRECRLTRLSCPSMLT